MEKVLKKGFSLLGIYIIFLIIWITGIAGRLISPLIDTMTEGILGLAMRIFGLL